MRPFTLACLTLLLIALSAFADVDTMWTRTYPDFNGQVLEFIGACGLADNGFAVCGFTFDENYNVHSLVARVNGQGNLLWMYEYGGEYSVDSWAVFEADDGALRVFCTEFSPDGANYLKMLALSADGDSLWARTYQGLVENGRRSVAKTSDGGFVIIADTIAEHGNSLIPWMMKVDAAGNTLWSHAYNIDGWAYGRRVIECTDGSILLAGEHFPSDTTWQSYFYLIRTNSSGVMQWTESYPIPTIDGAPSWGGQVISLAEIDNGDFFVSGITAGWEWWNAGFLMKFDADGDLFWTNDPGGFIGMYFNGIAVDPAGGCKVVGTDFPIEVGSISPFIQEFGPAGEAGEFWQPVITQNYGLTGVCPANNGGHLAYGYSSDPSGASRGGYIVRMGPPTSVSGRVTDLVHNQPLQGVRVTVDFDNAYDVTDANGDFFIATTALVTDILFSGPCIAPDTLESVALIQGQQNVRNFSVGVPEFAHSPSSVNLAIRFDIEETVEVTIRNPGSGDLPFTAEALPQTPNYNWFSVSPAEGILAHGQSRILTLTILADSEHGSAIDFYGTIQVRNHSCPDSIANIPISAIALGTEEQPSHVREFALHPAYPNPFNAATELRFDLPSSTPVQLNLFDISGRLVRTLVDERLTAGTHSVNVDLANAASGIYFVRMNAGCFTASRKIVLIK